MTPVESAFRTTRTALTAIQARGRHATRLQRVLSVLHGARVWRAERRVVNGLPMALGHTSFEVGG